MTEISLPEDFIKQDIKKQAIEAEELEKLSKLAGSYEALFSRRARLYTQRKLKEKQLSEADYRDLILEHYTFLKRPVLVNGDEIFVGATKKTEDAIKKSFKNN